MLYCVQVAPTTSTTDDADGTSANVTLNGWAQKILYVGGYEVDATHTTAEGRHMSVITTGDVTWGGGPVSRIPLGTTRHAAFVGGDSLAGSRLADTFYPVNWTTGPNAVVTANTRGIGGTVAEEADVFYLYSDGESHPSAMPIWGGGRGLRGIPSVYVRNDLTAITASTAATNGAAITVPSQHTTIVGIATVEIKDGTIVAADELNSRVRYTGTGLPARFEPHQIWPINNGAADAGLQGLANASVDHESVTVEFIPHLFQASPNSTITAEYTMRSAITAATEHYDYIAFV